MSFLLACLSGGLTAFSFPKFNLLFLAWVCLVPLFFSLSPICYEIIFPRLVRKFPKKGAEFLVTISNDGWHGTSLAPYQHFLIAVFRAVENRRFLLRAATTGISGIVDPYGRILSRSDLMTQTYLTGNIASLKKLSFYARCGDVLPVPSLTLSGIFFILALAKTADERKKAGRRGQII